MSISSRDQLIAAARLWLGTPARHGMALRGLGVDDVRLVLSVGEACGLLPASDAPAAYPQHPTPDDLAGRLAAALTPIAAAEALPGDVVQLGDRCAILAEHDGNLTLIRAEEPHGARVLATGQPAHRVVEHGFRSPWPERACGWFRYPGQAE
jgi:hypothetical protein